MNIIIVIIITIIIILIIIIIIIIILLLLLFGQSPSHAAKTRRCSQQWDQNIGNKYAMFTAISPTILTGYSAVVT